jgi:hypothetical protein
LVSQAVAISSDINRIKYRQYLANFLAKKWLTIRRLIMNRFEWWESSKKIKSLIKSMG